MPYFSAADLSTTGQNSYEFNKVVYAGSDGPGTLLSVYTQDYSARISLDIPNSFSTLGSYSGGNVSIDQLSSLFTNSPSPYGTVDPLIYGTIGAGLTPSPQIVYVDLAQNSNAILKVSGLKALINGVANTVYNKPDAGLDQNGSNLLLQSLRKIYSGYNVIFTTDKPTSGSYHTIFVGGTVAMPASINPSLLLNIPPNINGISQSINIDDYNHSESAVVFSGNSGLNGASNIPALAEVIAHETGHLLGLQHDLLPTDLMYPYNSVTAYQIPDEPIPLAEIRKSDGVVTPTIFTQNSAADLRCAVGALGQNVDCSDADVLGTIKVSLLSSLFGTIYNAQVEFFPSVTDGDTGGIIESVGNLVSGNIYQFNIPDFAGDQFALYGTSSQGANDNIFLAYNNDPSNNLLSISQVNNPALQITFFEQSSDGEITPYIDANIVIQNNIEQVPEPSSWSILLIPLLTLTLRPRKHVQVLAYWFGNLIFNKLKSIRPSRNGWAKLPLYYGRDGQWRRSVLSSWQASHITE